MDYVEMNKCGSCKYYTYEGNIRKAIAVGINLITMQMTRVAIGKRETYQAPEDVFNNSLS